jgi:hypothetical protein
MSLDSIYQTRGDITNPNLKSVLAKLAVMNPQQLQAFAAANEDDPIMLSAAQAVHSKHKEFAEAMMAQQGGQMPPVNQQVVQNMNPAPQGGQGMPPQGMPPQGMPPQGMPPQGGPLPEEQGIAQLPTPNIQNMAGGGIVAFADGGYTDEDMMSNGEPVIRMADGGHVPRYQGVPTAMGGDGSLVSSNPMFNIPGMTAVQPRASFTQQGAPENTPLFERIANKIREQGKEATLFELESRVRRGIATPEEKAFYQNEKVKSGDAAAVEAKYPAKDAIRAKDFPGVSANFANIDPSVFDTGTPKTTSASASAPAPGTKPPAPGTKPAAPVADKTPEGLEALTSRFTRESDLAQGALMNQRAGLRTLLEQEATDEAAAVKKRVKDEGDVFAGKEERLAKREQGITGMKNENLGLALLQAGAAIMSTPGNLGEAVGIGVQVGSKSYIAGMDKINAAQEKFADARERLEDLRLNRKDMNAKEIQAADRFIRTARIQGQQLMLDGATNDLKISTDNQRAIFTTAADAIQTDKKLASAESLSRSEIAARERIAQLPQGQERIASLLGNGDLAVGLAKFAEIQAGKFNPTTAYTDYISKRKEGDTVLTPQEFVTQIRSIQALMAKVPPSAVDTSKPDRQ